LPQNRGGKLEGAEPGNSSARDNQLRSCAVNDGISV
jgi:hypothetical protein